ncbi:MAG TPA: hypothetical protein VKM55_30065 [Candidatus Lokiarchaeia archaeon]|nr:hypothetical protein [Candidatus Lokiarchaeia archaeon]
MDKEKLMVWLPGILAILGIGLPILLSSEVAFWSWGLVITSHGEVYNMIVDAESSSSRMIATIFLIFFIIDAAGIVLYILKVTSIMKLPNVSWLPGLLMLAGMGFPAYYMIITIPDNGFVFPLGVIVGIIGGIWVLVIGIKEIPRKS